MLWRLIRSTRPVGIALPEEKAQFADLRLRDGLDPARHFTQQNLVTILGPKQPFVIEDVAGSRFETYDSLGKVYRLYSTLSKDPKLAEFAFVTPVAKAHDRGETRTVLEVRLPRTRRSSYRKRTRSSSRRSSSHSWPTRKTRHSSITGSSANDLARFLQPWEYGRLNVPERILLARRTAGEPVKTARHLSDLLRLNPPTPITNSSCSAQRSQPRPSTPTATLSRSSSAESNRQRKSWRISRKRKVRPSHIPAKPPLHPHSRPPPR
jgi:hypothetical protein